MASPFDPVRRAQRPAMHADPLVIAAVAVQFRSDLGRREARIVTISSAIMDTLVTCVTFWTVDLDQLPRNKCHGFISYAIGRSKQSRRGQIVASFRGDR